VNTADDLNGLTPDDLELRGKFFTNDFPLRFEDTVEAFRILAPKAGWGMFFTSLIILAFFVGFWIVVDRCLVQITKNEKIVFESVIIAIGILTILAYVAISWMRQRYLKLCSPLLEYKKHVHSMSIFNKSRSFREEDIVCVLSLTNWHGHTAGKSLETEMDLITQAAGQRERHVIATISDSTGKYFDELLTALRTATGLQVLKARPEGPLGTGPMTVHDL
jgi:hypothetical protein